MPHTLNPAIPITLDKDRSLLYGAAAFIEYKEATGRDLLKTFRALSTAFQDARGEGGEPNPEFELPLREFRDILWAGLIHEDESLTPKQTSNLFTIGMMSELVPVVLRAFMLGLGTPQADDDRPRRAPAKKHTRSTGAVSGPLRVATSG